MAGNPLDQFKIQYLTDYPEVFGYNINITNSSVFMFIVVALVSTFFIAGMRRRLLVPTRLQSAAEVMYEFVADMIKSNVGDEGRHYFPFIFTLFVFVLFANLLGMVPGAFTVTSHIAVTFALASFIFIAVTVIGFIRHGIKYLGFFLPHGTPWILAPLMIVIEVFSYFSRPCSHSIRLAANMLAGHILMKVLAGFVIALGVGLGWMPLLLLTLITGFELFVALLQAYIFALLTCVYLNDAINMH